MFGTTDDDQVINPTTNNLSAQEADQDEFLRRMPPEDVQKVLNAKKKMAEKRESIAASPGHDDGHCAPSVMKTSTLPKNTILTSDMHCDAAPEDVSEKPDQASSDTASQSESPRSTPNMESQELPIHPTAALFPVIAQDELQAMGDDIRMNGQRHPILTWHGQVIDGQNRLRACRLAGVNPMYEGRDDISEQEITAYIVSLNMCRRHLSTAQREVIAASLVTQVAGKPRIQNAQAPQDGQGTPQAVTRDMAAKAMNVSSAGVERARTLERKDPALAAKVRSGEIVHGKPLTVSTALKAHTATSAPAAPQDGRRKTTEAADQGTTSNIAALIKAVEVLDMAWRQVETLNERLNDDEVKAGFVQMVSRLAEAHHLNCDFMLIPIRKLETR